ncbi:hypothetical protein KSP39_PZI013997 [Platanthera zijinensis]|uniref:Uncharacterized protein n=1 Tax=Platanthera zijinensis TaxID=2320716 RepID=A0AAP0BDM5_9ASPA
MKAIARQLQKSTQIQALNVWRWKISLRKFTSVIFKEIGCLAIFIFPSEIDEHAFENFVVVEEHRRLKKPSIEQAERERQAEEQYCRDIEQKSMEADIAQEKMEAEKRHKACKSVMAFVTDVLVL